MPKINKFFRLWLNNAAPRKYYIEYYLEKLKLKDGISNIDWTKFIDHRVKIYENFKRIVMDQGDIKCRD